MTFIKGHIINLGRVRGTPPLSVREKISLTKSSMNVLINGITFLSKINNLGRAECNKCGVERVLSYDTAIRINGLKANNICYKCSNAGRAYSKEINLKKGRKKEKNNKWKGGVSKINEIIRGSADYKEWRRKVFARDNWTCMKCSVIGGEINAHHIKKFCEYLDLRFVIENGITLCKKCHAKEHSKKSK